MSTLEMYGYSSHLSLHDVCNDKEYEAIPDGKHYPQNVGFIGPPSDEERARRELSAIVEDREDNTSEGKVSDVFFPVFDSQSIEREDFRTTVSSGYVEEGDVFQFPNPVVSYGVKACPLISSSEEKHVVGSDGYVEEQVLQRVSTSPPKSGNEGSLKAGDYVDETATHSGLRSDKDNESQVIHDSHDSLPNGPYAMPRNHPTIQNGGNEVRLPLPSDSSADTTSTAAYTTSVDLETPAANHTSSVEVNGNTSE